MANILVFGSSIAYGAWDKEAGWAQRLKKYFDRKSSSESDCYFTYNLGISGNTSDDLLLRFDFEISQRVKFDKGSVVIFQIGLNDSLVIDKKGKQIVKPVAPEKFKNNLKKLIKKAKKFSSRIVFLGLTPVDKRVDPIPWYKIASYKIERVREYNQIIKEVCKKEKVFFVETFKYFEDDTKKLLEDGLHPNSRGHEKIFEIVKKLLIEKIFKGEICTQKK